MKFSAFFGAAAYRYFKILQYPGTYMYTCVPGTYIHTYASWENGGGCPKYWHLRTPHHCRDACLTLGARIISSVVWTFSPLFMPPVPACLVFLFSLIISFSGSRAPHIPYFCFIITVFSLPSLFPFLLGGLQLFHFGVHHHPPPVAWEFEDLHFSSQLFSLRGIHLSPR